MRVVLVELFAAGVSYFSGINRERFESTGFV